LDLRQSKPSPVVKAATPVTKDSAKEDGEVSPEPEGDAESSSTVKGKGKEVSPDKESWVKKTSKGGNMSLMTVQKRYVFPV